MMMMSEVKSEVRSGMDAEMEAGIFASELQQGKRQIDRTANTYELHLAHLLLLKVLHTATGSLCPLELLNEIRHRRKTTEHYSKAPVLRHGKQGLHKEGGGLCGLLERISYT